MIGRVFWHILARFCDAMARRALRRLGANVAVSKRIVEAENLWLRRSAKFSARIGVAPVGGRE